MRKTLFILLFSWSVVWGQIYQNPFSEERLERAVDGYLHSADAGRFFNLSDSLSALFGGEHLRIGAEGCLGYLYAPVSPYAYSTDKTQFYVSPYFIYRPLENFAFILRPSFHNEYTNLLYRERPYYGDTFSGVAGDVEVSAFVWEQSRFQVKFGRDYILPTPVFYENLLFSSRQYGYDQIKISYHDRFLKLSALYAPLNEYFGLNRALYLHRVEFVIPRFGYFALNDAVIYGSEAVEFNLASFNPFIPFFVYQYNENAGGNTLMSAEIFLKLGKRYFLFGEFLLDDYQIESGHTEDLEPNEFGMNITAGVLNLISGWDWKINYTMVSNRTYNVKSPYERYIYKFLPMGHYLGNNFWMVQTTFSRLTEKFASRIDFIYREFGEDALYVPFNEDFMNYTWEEGYNEPFPFGKVSRQAGITVRISCNVNSRIKAYLRAGYWTEKGNLPESLAFSFGIAGNIEKTKDKNL